MIRWLALLLAWIVLGLPLAPDPREPAASELSPVETLESLRWLEGSWSGKTRDGGTWEARYSTSTGGLVLSVNKKLVRGKVVLFEFEKFEVRGKDVILTPYPNGKMSAASFTLRGYDPAVKKAEFLNPEHDFPQRIYYERASEDELVIEATADRDGKRSGLRLELKRQGRGG